MYKSFIALVVIAAFLLLAGCSTGNTVKTSLDKQVTIAIGQSAQFSGENLTIKLIDVTEDSRCPKDVTCIWAGQVSCALEVNINGATQQVRLTQGGSGTDPARQPVDGYTFTGTVDPYPESGKQIAKTDYRLNLTVSK